MSMPEEINRIITDRIFQLLFCPTETAVRNLINEGIVDGAQIMPKPRIVLNVSDVMYDAALYYKKVLNPL